MSADAGELGAWDGSDGSDATASFGAFEGRGAPDSEALDESGAAPDFGAWNGPAILLVDLDAFFASVEQLDHPEWRGKPVIVGGDAESRGVVATCSYEARRYGVRSAMASATAERLCPDAIWTHGHFHRYRELSDQVMAILRDETPFVEQVSIDEAFMDVTPSAINPEHPIAIANRIQERVAALGVSCSIGVATSKSAAKIASDMDKPRGLTVVYPGSEAAFLGPLPIRALSGIGPAAERALHDAGISTLGDLGAADLAVLQRVFGKRAEEMHARAIGVDLGRVRPDDETKSVSNEMTFAHDLTDRESVRSAIATMADKVGRRLRRHGLRGRVLSLRVRYEDRSTRSIQQTLDEPTDDELAFTPLLFEMVEELWSPGVRVRLLGVGMAGFDGDVAAAQERMFDDDADSHSGGGRREPLIADERQRRDLLKATDALRERFGESSIRFGHELRHLDNTTHTSSKNLTDYR